MQETFNSLQDLGSVRLKGIKTCPDPFKHITDFHSNCTSFNKKKRTLKILYWALYFQLLGYNGWF